MRPLGTLVSGRCPVLSSEYEPFLWDRCLSYSVAWVVLGDPPSIPDSGFLPSAARVVKPFSGVLALGSGWRESGLLGHYGDWAHRVCLGLAEGHLLTSGVVKAFHSGRPRDGGPSGIAWFTGCLTGTPLHFLCRRGLFGQLGVQRDGALGLVSGEPGILAL